MPSMSSVDINGTLRKNWLALTIIGQRVFPQRNLEPLHKTHKLSWRALVTICDSSTVERLLAFSRLSNQLLPEPEFPLTFLERAIRKEGYIRFDMLSAQKNAKTPTKTHSQQSQTMIICLTVVNVKPIINEFRTWQMRMQTRKTAEANEK